MEVLRVKVLKKRCTVFLMEVWRVCVLKKCCMVLPMEVLRVCVLKKCCMVSEQRLMQSCSSWLGLLSSNPNMSRTPMNPSVAWRIALFSIAEYKHCSQLFFVIKKRLRSTVFQFRSTNFYISWNINCPMNYQTSIFFVQYFYVSYPIS